MIYDIILENNSYNFYNVILPHSQIFKITCVHNHSLSATCSITIKITPVYAYIQYLSVDHITIYHNR